MVEYTTFKDPCIDKYPAGKNFISDTDIKQVAEQRVQQSLRGGKLSASGKKKAVRKNFTKLKAAFKVASIWDKGTDINIFFLDGTPKQQNWVKKVVNEKLAPICDQLNFNFDRPEEESVMRVSFALPGQAWSYVGTDCLDIPPRQPTMNLGWLDNDVQYTNEKYKNTGQVVLHEFCHALGMIHEHQNPKGNAIVWNKPVVYQALAETNGWNEEQVDHNMFKKYGDKEKCEEVKAKEDYPGKELDIEGYCEGEEVNGSEYDIRSIMHYFYPPEWILEGPKKIPVNTKLSKLDEKWLRKYYGTPKVEEDEEEDEDENEEEGEEKEEEEVEDEVDEELREEFTLMGRPCSSMFIVVLTSIMILLIMVSIILFLLVRNDR